MTDEQIVQAKSDIDAMSQEEMARLWRFAPAGHPYFDKTLPSLEVCSSRASLFR
jgi:hypothetical protein